MVFASHCIVIKPLMEQFLMYFSFQGIYYCVIKQNFFLYFLRDNMQRVIRQAQVVEMGFPLSYTSEIKQKQAVQIKYTRECYIYYLFII